MTRKNAWRRPGVSFDSQITHVSHRTPPIRRCIPFNVNHVFPSDPTRHICTSLNERCTHLSNRMRADSRPSRINQSAVDASRPRIVAASISLRTRSPRKHFFAIEQVSTKIGSLPSGVAKAFGSRSDNFFLAGVLFVPPTIRDRYEPDTFEQLLSFLSAHIFRQFLPATNSPFWLNYRAPLHVFHGAITAVAYVFLGVSFAPV